MLFSIDDTVVELDDIDLGTACAELGAWEDAKVMYLVPGKFPGNSTASPPEKEE